MKSAARFERRSGLATGTNYNDYTDYFGVDYGVGWLNNVNMAVKLVQEKAANPEYPYENNLLQMSRIWRAYVISELVDNFGPVPPANALMVS